MTQKALLVSLAVLVVLVGGYFVYEKFGISQQAPVSATNDQTTTGTTNNTTTTTPPPATATGFKDGTYVGPETSSIYGKAKVTLVISGGKIVDVQFPEYPNDRETTIMKSNLAMPAIKAEIIAAQSVNVNTVSGATQTADSFIQSAASALAQASAS